jgi:hypothetical protein
MLRDVIPDLAAGDPRIQETRPLFSAQDPRRPLQRSDMDLEQLMDQFPEQSHFPLHTGGDPAGGLNLDAEIASQPGHSLFQEMFFFCTVKKVADLPGSGCIYVETVVDRDSGISFAKVYTSKNAMNAVDILASRVLPFFRRQRVAVKEIHTRKTTEYCGYLPLHAYEAFLSAAHIRHLPIEHFGQSCNYICEEFYRHLLKNFFPAGLRRKFPLSLRDLQKDLDTFIEAYNAAQIGHQVI